MTPEQDKQAMDDRRRKLESLAESLLKKRDEAVIFRTSSGVERRWKEDQEIFDIDAATGSRAMIDYASGEATPRGNTGPVRSKVVVNIIRGKCETAEGRFSDILLPVDDKNWGMQVTPVPDLVKGLKDDRQAIDTTTEKPMTNEDGSPVKASDIARAQMDKAEEAMKGMETEVDDQLTECQYNGECRKVIRKAIRLGTGVLKGPNVIKSIRKAWVPKTDGDTTVHVLQSVEEQTPASKSVDPRNVFPDPKCGSDVRRTASYIWEYDEILPRDLRSLVGVEGYYQDQIEAVFKEEPQRTQVGAVKNKLEIQKQALDRGHSYEKWEYHGDVNKDDLEALGFKNEDLGGQSLSACVVFVNDRPIKIQLNILDTGDMIYDFFQWTQVDGSPWGIGIPRMAVWQQRIIIAAWRAMMDNARDSSGANVIIGPGVEPVDGKWELTGKKLWRVLGVDIDDARKAFAQFQLESNQADLQAIIELALRFSDMETQIPMLFQGEKAEAPETLGATNIMVDSNNVSLRTRVKLWDDQVTVPHITRYYHWNMQYSENPDIKGDYNVDARGTSVLLARDQQAQSLINVMQLRGDPRVDAEVDWGKAVRQLFEALRLDIAKSDEDKKRDEEQQQDQGQPEDPRIQAANIKAQGDMQKAKLTQESDKAELGLKAQEAERQRQHDIDMKQFDYQIKLMEFSQESGLSLQNIKKELAVEASKQNLMRELADKKAEAPQTTNPPVEPAGRASEGRAYQQ